MLRDILEEALRGQQADYIDVRIEERESTHLSFRGRELEEVGQTVELGGNVRALVKRGWGFVSFNDPSDLRQKVELAIHHARLVNDNVGGSERTLLAESGPVVATVPSGVKRDPRAVALADKKRLMDEYVACLWSAGPKIQTTRVNYSDSYRRRYFADSRGSFVEQERADCHCSFIAVAREGDNVQQAHFSTGGIEGFDAVERLHGQVAESGRRAVALLEAKPVKGGEYTVVLDPLLAGVFAHEAFGHLSEADFLYENPMLRDIMVLGRRFGERHLSIVDDATLPGLRGSYQYDDEGTPARKVYLIREGVLVGRLHSRETAGKMGEEPTGNARAISYRHRPIVRMTNTYIEPGGVSLEEMIGDIKEGVYAQRSFGGQTSKEMFTFSAGEAHMIRHGAIAEPVRGVLLSGNVFTTLQNIDAIGSDLVWSQGGGCGKGGQSPLPVATGSPHIRVRKCVVGGR